MHQRSKLGRVILACAILVLVLVLLYSGLQILESTVLHNSASVELTVPRKTIVRDGVEYFPRQDTTVILLAGIDEMGPVRDSGSYNNYGEADMVSLLIFDEGQQELNIISLNRDTMMDIQILGLNGKPAGSKYSQLALAHTYGSGLDDSCENLRDTVSNFLYGIHIDYYVALNMDAIMLLNDAVGGVTVTVTDDFSQVDSTIPMGEVTLQGEQALNFVQTRQGVGNQLNLSRMERQKEYMEGFMEALQTRIDQDSSFVTESYDQVSDYMVTDCSVKVLGSLLNQYNKYGLGEIVTIQGENIKGDKYMEYHIDKEALDNVVLEYLYAPKS